MFKVKLSDKSARDCAAQALRVARGTFRDPQEIFGFAITIATNCTSFDREAGNFARAKAYERAGLALDAAAPTALN